MHRHCSVSSFYLPINTCFVFVSWFYVHVVPAVVPGCWVNPSGKHRENPCSLSFQHRDRTHSLLCDCSPLQWACDRKPKQFFVFLKKQKTRAGITWGDILVWCPAPRTAPRAPCLASHCKKRYPGGATKCAMCCHLCPSQRKELVPWKPSRQSNQHNKQTENGSE